MWGSKVAVTTDHQDPQMLGKLSGELWREMGLCCDNMNMRDNKDDASDDVDGDEDGDDDDDDEDDDDDDDDDGDNLQDCTG